MSLEDVARRAAAVAAVAAVATLAGAGAWIAFKHPELGRRALKSLARGAEKLRLALAETAEELCDLWAEARDEVAAEIEAKAFDGAGTPALAAPGPKTKPSRARKPRRTRTQGDEKSR
ncbi:MAG: hypothetical protein IPK27_22405 [Rhodanobacteraceae bacterium]|nr:hypothetical protein [Rhodanobacteraceae bacterium]